MPYTTQPSDAISVEEYHAQLYAGMSENALLGHILGHCRTFGLLHHHLFEQGRGKPCPACGANVPGRYARRTDSGFPDLLILPPGRAVYVELKSEKGKVTNNQRRWLNSLAAVHREVYLVRPSTENLLLEVLMAEGQPVPTKEMQKIIWKEGMK